jgi:hypothetical protein
MITDKSTYKYYLKKGLAAYQLKKITFFDYFRQDCLRFQLRLRKIEYLQNVCRKNIFCRIYLFLGEIINHH